MASTVCDATRPAPVTVESLGKRRLRCAEVFGGTRNIDLDVGTRGLHASVYSRVAHGEGGGGGGGDVYYFSVCASDMLTRIAVADVAGHGAAVRQLGTWMHQAIVARMNALEGDSLLASLNALACRRGFEALTTASVLSHYRANSTLYFASAGHPPLFIRRRTDSSWWEMTVPARPGAANLPLGILPETTYDQGLLTVAPGDRIFLYTDGVTESATPHRAFFGRDRLRAVLNRAGDASSAQLKAEVRDALDRFAAGNLGHYDVTLVAAEIR